MTFKSILLTFLSLTISISFAFATISENLASKLRKSEDVSVYLFFEEQFDLQNFNEIYKNARLTNSQRRDILVPKLKELANRTQKNVISFLEIQNRNYENYESLFLTNSIFIKNPKPELIYELESFAEIQEIELYEEPTYEKPIHTKYSPAQIDTSSDVFHAIKATKLWKLGIDGTGRIVMNIDSGVDGNHTHLASSWYGLQPNVLPQNAWFDAVGQGSTFPEDLDTSTHGTSTISLMCGRTATDTIGTAPGAWWISSKHEDGIVNGLQNPFSAFTWVSGLPANVLNKLDVINNSYNGNYGGCAPLSAFQTIQSIESIGVSAIWSAGNDGPEPKTIGQYGAGAISEVQVFCIGSLHPDQTTISGFSSRGPSGCASGVIVPPPHQSIYKIKPEVVVQGYNLIAAANALQGGGTKPVSGTSYSAPVAAATIALLRQIDPLITVSQAKSSLLNTATDFGSPGDDNAYGTGRIDVLAAAGEVSPYFIVGDISDNSNGNPIPFAVVKVVETEQVFESAIDGSFTAKPILDTITLEVKAFGYQPTIISNIPQLSVGTPFTQNISLIPNSTGTISGTFTDDLGNSILGEVVVYAETEFGEFEFDFTTTDANGNYSLTLPEENYRIEFLPEFPFLQKELTQISVNSGQNLILDYSGSEASVLLFGADNSSAVDSVYKNLMFETDLDFVLWDLDETPTLPQISELSLLAQPSVVVWYSDSKSGDVLSNSQEQFLVDYLNSGGNLLLTGQNIVQSENGGTLMNLLEVSANGNHSNSNDFVKGEGLLQNKLMRTKGANYDNFQTSKDILSLSGNAIPLGAYGELGNEGVAISQTNGTNWKAILMGFDLASVQSDDTLATTTNLQLLKKILSEFGQTVSVSEHQNSIPKTFSLSQNYPNPFNPTTSINYELRITNYEKSRLVIFNVLGETVKEFELTKPQGTVVWNGTNFGNKQVSSGVYFYRIETGNKFSQTKKMVFIK
ncbi:MAG: T9SS C-terminal target domain-containing protein [Calditrichaeota bacterium]|nr:MAG: T9SS C-terminal target domain-containing protein [Calditrichota bacterium]